MTSPKNAGLKSAHRRTQAFKSGMCSQASNRTDCYHDILIPYKQLHRWRLVSSHGLYCLSLLCRIFKGLACQFPGNTLWKGWLKEECWSGALRRGKVGERGELRVIVGRNEGKIQSSGKEKRCEGFCSWTQLNWSFCANLGSRFVHSEARVWVLLSGYLQ